jgi:hypothetical protein
MSRMAIDILKVKSSNFFSSINDIKVLMREARHKHNIVRIGNDICVIGSTHYMTFLWFLSGKNREFSLSRSRKRVSLFKDTTEACS